MDDELGALRELVAADAQHRPGARRVGRRPSAVSRPDPTPAWYTLTFGPAVEVGPAAAPLDSEPARNQLTCIQTGLVELADELAARCVDRWVGREARRRGTASSRS